ncbi:hypothetical protein [Actinocorallia populi]|uniref:hypothetical protein n=1 Tax=Actinocorallia populi TaxID=2079200 RepID=UPI000D08F4E5|nr:hypothetical protein [Actinocorallia populi]
MLRAQDLFHGTAEPETAPLPERDPLREPDVLLDAQLLDTRVETLVSRAGLLLELRTTMEFTKGDAALLVAHGVREFTWTAASRPVPPSAWTVASSVPGASDGLFTLDLVFLPEARLRLTAERAEFYVADVPRLAPRVPDYETDDPAAIRNNLPAWTSPFSLRGACALP